jgi:hypothetical protein
MLSGVKKDANCQNYYAYSAFANVYAQLEACTILATVTNSGS